MINAVDPDSDNDGLYDALERGYKPGDVTVDTNLSRPFFVPDNGHIKDLPCMGSRAFPYTDQCTTDSYDNDTAIEKSLRDFPWHRSQVFDDYDYIDDGKEDANRNGRIDGDNGDGKYDSKKYWTETNPNMADTHGEGVKDLDEITDDEGEFPDGEDVEFDADESSNPLDPNSNYDVG